MTVAYCTPRHVFDLGLSAQAFVVRPRVLDGRAGDSLDAATGTFWMLGHGLDASDLVWLILVAQGGTNALPAGASALVPYHPLPLDFRRFRLSLSEGGAAVTFGVMLLLNRAGVKALQPFWLLGLILWGFMLLSGVHATIADHVVEMIQGAAKELVANGARGITTSCGFLSLFQAPLAARIGVPVTLLSLLVLWAAWV